MSLYELTGKKVWVAGHSGMVGNALTRRLRHEDCELLLSSREELDLVSEQQTEDWIGANRPDAIILAAAKVGGIGANIQAPVQYLRENLMIQNNIMSTAANHKVERLLFIASACIYPVKASQPIKETEVMTGPLEKSLEGYALAKITGLKLCQAYRRQNGLDWISVVPPNLYGPGDNYDKESSHVLASLLRRLHEARVNNSSHAVVWGTGTVSREFLHCEDLADALVFILKNYSDDSHINVGSGREVTIKELAQIIADVVGYEGELYFDSSKPDGAPRKLLCSERLQTLGWQNVRPLGDGIRHAYGCWQGDKCLGG